MESELSEAQRQCLRLVAKGLTSKEIARHVELKPATVDQYIHRAKVLLNADDRRDAARIFLEKEELGDVISFEFNPPALAGPAVRRSQPGLHEEQGTRTGESWQSRLLWLPPLGGQPNEMQSARRFEAMLRIAMLSLVVLIGMILLIRAAFNTFA